jgi:hypothetical protein
MTVYSKIKKKTYPGGHYKLFKITDPEGNIEYVDYGLTNWLAENNFNKANVVWFHGFVRSSRYCFLKGRFAGYRLERVSEIKNETFDKNHKKLVREEFKKYKIECSRNKGKNIKSKFRWKIVSPNNKIFYSKISLSKLISDNNLDEKLLKRFYEIRNKKRNTIKSGKFKGWKVYSSKRSKK